MDITKICGIFKIHFLENILKVILHDEKYLSLTSEIFLQKNTRCGQIIIYTVFILLVAICVSLFTIRIDEVVKVQGVVKTQTNISTVKNIVSGKILNINYFSGKIVKKNDLLFKIDDSNLVLKLNSEKATKTQDYENYLGKLKTVSEEIKVASDSIHNIDIEIAQETERYDKYTTICNDYEEEKNKVENKRFNS